MDRIRVATLQYFIRPVLAFDEFAAQVRGLVETARDYRCHLLVFPEYFTLQLLTLADVRRPLRGQLRDLAALAPRFVELVHDLARKNGLYIIAGSIPVQHEKDPDVIFNDCHVFSPAGRVGVQGKFHMTRFEDEEWSVSPRNTFHVFEAGFGRFAVTICYDVEFPELARAAALEGAHLLIVPSCTDDRQGFLRVRYCAQARAVENQMFVVHASTVGSLPGVPAVSLNYGQASILTPSDFQFSRDGILAEGIPNQETMVIGELNMRLISDVRDTGTVLPLRDSRRTATVLSTCEVVPL